ncbi:MAG: Gfo/Idh/MocA family oxidoreductase, partial [Clostridia bacterium]|nr:Gfo/Idh/MocA family oxidoreductase [Clostridia bacterium]
MKKFTAIVCGAGQRGTSYSRHMKNLSEKFDIVGVAEPIETRRNNIKDMFGIPEENCYLDYKDILSKPKMADIAIIATQDNMHTAPALMAIEKGYNLLLEKPVAQTPEECIEIATAAKKKGVKVLVCHVLRYTPFYKTVKKAVMDGLIGDIMSVMAVEGVGNTHQSHSYVRGDWKCEKESTPMLLAKCCHDLDIIQWIVDKPCDKVSSFGELTYFKPENAPEGAPKRCYNTDCPARESCPYDVNKV